MSCELVDLCLGQFGLDHVQNRDAMLKVLAISTDSSFPLHTCKGRGRNSIQLDLLKELRDTL